MKRVNLAIVGATGMVGRTFLKVLEERKFPINNLYLFSSEKSAGTELVFGEWKMRCHWWFQKLILKM